MSKNSDFKKRIRENKDKMNDYNSYLPKDKTFKKSYKKNDNQKQYQKKNYTPRNIEDSSLRAKTFPIRMKKTYNFEDEYTTWTNVYNDIVELSGKDIPKLFLLPGEEDLEMIGETESTLHPDIKYDDAVIVLATNLTKSIPRLLGKRYIHCQYKISANQVSIRTEANYGFEWKVEYNIDPDTKRAKITTVNLTLILYKYSETEKEEFITNLTNRKFIQAINRRK